jgi:ribosomal protein L7Ae-like RNA K-turn-binding protein
VLRLLGIAARAGEIVPGTERVREGLRARHVRLVFLAADGSAEQRRKLIPALRAGEIQYVTRYDRAALGAAVGRSPLGAVGVTSGPLAERLVVLVSADASADAVAGQHNELPES